MLPGHLLLAWWFPEVRKSATSKFSGEIWVWNSNFKSCFISLQCHVFHGSISRKITVFGLMHISKCCVTLPYAGKWVDFLGMKDSAKYVGTPQSVAIRIPDCSVTTHLIDLVSGPTLNTFVVSTGLFEVVEWQQLQPVTQCLYLCSSCWGNNLLSTTELAESSCYRLFFCHQVGPIVVTSANPTGEADTTHHNQVYAKLGDKVIVALCLFSPAGPKRMEEHNYSVPSRQVNRWYQEYGRTSN